MAGVASDRFASLNCDDLDKILTEKDSKNTKRSTDVAVKIFKTYLREKELPENFEEASASSLDDQLTRFYAEVRQVNGQKYKTTTLTAVRHGINRYLQLKTAGMDIINGGDFKESKQMFAAVTKDLKREGKGGITHYLPIETCDLQKMYEYFDLESNVKLQQKVLVDIMMYFGRRGRENLHLLKISDFAATTDSTGHLFIFMPNDELTKNHQDNPNKAEGRMYARKDDPMCPVRSFMKYKKKLNVKCNRLFQRPSRGTLQCYDNCPVGHNTLGTMMPNISVSAGLSKRYTNHSLRATSVHVLDKEQFASRHIMSVTGHQSEKSLKTYTGYTDQNIKKRMSDTISESLNPSNDKKVCTRSSENQPNELRDENLNLASGVLEPVSNAEFNQIVQDLATDDGEFDRLLTTIDTNNMVVPGSSNTLNYANNHMTKQSMMNVPVPVFNSCSNITINYNFNK